MLSSFCLDICSVIILLVLVIITFVKKNWSNLVYIVHCVQLVVCLVSASLHLSYEIILMTGIITQYTKLLATILIYLFFIVQSLIYPVATIYILASIGIWYEVVNRKKIFFAFILISSIPVIHFITNIYNHRYFQLDSNLNLIVSDYFYFIYSIMALTMILCFSLLIVYRKYLSKNGLRSGLFLCPANFVAIIAQAFFPDIQFLSFIFANTCYFVALLVQRSEVLISPYSKAHSSYMFFSDTYKSISMKTPCNYVFIKILNFKNIQSYIGKQNCSTFLNHFSRMLNNALQEAKISGEVYYLENAVFAVSTKVGTVEKLTEKFIQIKNDLNNVILIEGFSIYIDASICVASYPDDIYNYEYLKYFSNNFPSIIPSTKEVVVVSDYSSNKHYLIKNEIEKIIDRALQNKYFEVLYQPIYSVEKDCFTSVEALLRLNDPEFGYIPPSIFIPFAENSKSIYKITDYVLETVTRFISSPEFLYLRLDNVEINLSMAQCVDPDLINKIQKHILENDVSPAQIRLEITENAFDTDSMLIEENIQMLKEKNIKFVLDNYGTGYTNIKELINLPLDYVKLDRSFIEEYDNPQIHIIVDDTIKMLKDIRKEILVEGIEREEHAEMFKKLGCSYLQGYYYSKPLTPGQLMEFLR